MLLPEVRSEERYLRMCARMADRFPLLPQAGMENHLYLLPGRVLKFYRWFIFRLLSAEEEEARRVQERELLELYAPALDSQIVALNEDGSVALDPFTRPHFCYGILVRQGVPFLESCWRPASHLQKRDWAARIGRRLAHLHHAFPLPAGQPPTTPEIMKEWLWEVCQVIDAHGQDKVALPPVTRSKLASSLERLIPLPEGAGIPRLHGDLNVANIVVCDDQIQFIDPGCALPLGVGGPNTRGLPFEAGWDLASMANSLRWEGGASSADAFLSAYAATRGWSGDHLTSHLRGWEALFCLMVAAVSVKHWEQLARPDHPLARALAHRRSTLPAYTGYFIRRAFHLLSI